MSDPEKFFMELFSLSGCFWIIFYLYANYAVRGFIVKRYIQETELCNTLFFKKYACFITKLPDFLSAGFYATHLIIFVWGWGFVKYIKAKRPNISYFDDIARPEYVTRHFTVREIAKAKMLLLSGIVFLLHVLIYFIIKFASSSF